MIFANNRRELCGGPFSFRASRLRCRAVSTVFANFTQLVLGRLPVPESGRLAFVMEVRQLPPVRRSPEVARFIAIGWALIAVKHVAIIWAVAHYHVPFHQLWINFPTWLLGVLATGVYYLGTQRV